MFINATNSIRDRPLDSDILNNLAANTQVTDVYDVTYDISGNSSFFLELNFTRFRDDNIVCYNHTTIDFDESICFEYNETSFEWSLFARSMIEEVLSKVYSIKINGEYRRVTGDLNFAIWEIVYFPVQSEWIEAFFKVQTDL